MRALTFFYKNSNYEMSLIFYLKYAIHKFYINLHRSAGFFLLFIQHSIMRVDRISLLVNTDFILYDCFQVGIPPVGVPLELHDII